METINNNKMKLLTAHEMLSEYKQEYIQYPKDIEYLMEKFHAQFASQQVPIRERIMEILNYHSEEIETIHKNRINVIIRYIDYEDQISPSDQFDQIASELTRVKEEPIIKINPNLKELKKRLDDFLAKETPESMNHFMQTRDLTDEEWLKLPKEEILQLYKNCYKLLFAGKTDAPRVGKEIVIYGAMFNPMIHESVSGVLSLHWTRKEAEMAISFHKAEEEKEFGVNNCQIWNIHEFKLSSLPASDIGVTITEEDISVYFSNHSNCYAKNPIKMPAMTRTEVILTVQYFLQHSNLVFAKLEVTDEEIKELIPYSDAVSTHQTDQNIGFIKGYRSALQHSRQPEASDEDIKKWAYTNHGQADNGYYLGIIDGAKAMRNGLIPSKG